MAMVPPTDPLLRLLKDYPTKKFAAGEMILYQGEVPTCAYVMKSGLVKVYNITAQGDEKPIAFRSSPDLLASAWIFDKSGGALYFCEAHTESVAYAVPKADFLRLIKQNNDALLNLLSRYVTLNTAGSLQLHALEFSKASDKIIHMLFYLCQTYGVDDPTGLVCIDLPLTQQELANLLGLTRETTGIELLKLKKMGLLVFSKKKYRVNKPQLLKLIGETEFENLAF